MTAPKGLGTTVRALWRSVANGLPEGWELDERERAILTLAARQADDLARLETAITRDGAMTTGSAGQPVVNAAITEARQARPRSVACLDSSPFLMRRTRSNRGRTPGPERRAGPLGSAGPHPRAPPRGGRG